MNKQTAINRKQIANSMKKNSVLILFSGSHIKSSADAQYPFVVNKNFYYLTQINEPNLILLLSKNEEILFIEESYEMYEKWVGKKITKQKAKEKSGIVDISFIDEFNVSILEKFDQIYLDLEANQINNCLSPAIEFKEKYQINALDAYPMLAKARAIKSKKEVEKISQAIKITNAGLESIMKNLQTNKKESVFEAYFDFILKSENVDHAFETIAASGINATTLHYVTNNEIVKDNDLILFDLGATSDLYCADISRTYPVNGKFNQRQKELYEMVLTANEMVINKIKPGVTMQQLNETVIKFYEIELKRLKVITDFHQVKDYYYHNVSHSLGLDTHDIGLSNDEPLVAGNVITVEPGIYIKEENIGIRIEDNILVTKNGNINLSKQIIKKVEDIEEFMKNAK